MVHRLKKNLKARRAWQATIAAASLNLIGMNFEAKIGASVPSAPQWPPYFSMTVGFAVIAILFLNRSKKSFPLSCALYLLNSLSVLFVFLYRNPFYAESLANWVPFQGNKLACLVTAMLAPNYWLGLFLLAAQTLGPMLEFVSFPPEIQQRLAHSEPWAMLVFGLTGFIGLTFRFRRFAADWKLIANESDNMALMEITRTMIDLRDRMNTPLQTIEFAAATLIKDNPNNQTTCSRIENAMDALREISLEMKKYDKMKK